jgi:hypothetical protein
MISPGRDGFLTQIGWASKPGPEHCSGCALPIRSRTRGANGPSPTPSAVRAGITSCATVAAAIESIMHTGQGGAA